MLLQEGGREGEREVRIVAPQTGTLPTIMLIRDFWFPNKYVHSCVKGFVGMSVQERICARAAGDC